MLHIDYLTKHKQANGQRAYKSRGGEKASLLHIQGTDLISELLCQAAEVWQLLGRWTSFQFPKITFVLHYIDGGKNETFQSAKIVVFM